MSTQQRDILEYLHLQLPYWASLNDALAHIQQVRGVDWASSRDELIGAVNAGKLTVRWLDQSGAADAPTRSMLTNEATIRPDHGGEILHQVTSLVLIEDAHGLRREKRVSEPVYRALLVDKASLLILWPSKLDKPPAISSLPVKRASAERICAAARELYHEHRADPPNINEAERLIRQTVKGSSRANIRRVLRQPEFATQRRPPGVRRVR
jgi:hypothetical protein